MESVILRGQARQLEAHMSSQAKEESAIQSRQRELLAMETKQLSEARQSFIRREWAERDDVHRLVCRAEAELCSGKAAVKEERGWVLVEEH